MTVKPYTTRYGVPQYKPVLSSKEAQRMMLDSDEGFCLACGETQSGVEPDARRYECESCGAAKVYGMQELLMLGLMEIK